jgi:hypothetical protein
MTNFSSNTLERQPNQTHHEGFAIGSPSPLWRPAGESRVLDQDLLVTLPYLLDNDLFSAFGERKDGQQDAGLQESLSFGNFPHGL